MTMNLTDLSDKVAATLEGELDFEETLALLDAAIVAEPRNAALFVLRASLYGESYAIDHQWADLKQAHALDAGNSEAALALALLQLKRAERLAESFLVEADGGDKVGEQHAYEAVEQDGAEVGDDDDDDWDAEPDPRVAALVRQLESESVALLFALLKAQDDPALATRLLDQLDEVHSLSPWTEYTLILKALAARPHELSLLKHEARFLVRLASNQDAPSEPVPSGYFESIGAQPFHALTIERALRSLDAVLALDADPALMVAKADLLVATEAYAEAAPVYLEAVQRFTQLAQAAPPEERDAILEQASEANTQAGLCQQGRGAFVDAHFAALREAMDKLAELRANIGDAGAPDEDYDTSFEQWRASLDAVTRGPNAQEQASLAESASMVAKKTVALISFDETVLAPLTEAQLEDGLAPWFGEIRPALEGAGLVLLTLFDNPLNTRQLQTQCQGQLWTDASGQSAFSVETARGIRLKRMLTELSDGTLVLTSDSRSKTFYDNGSAVDTVSVDTSTPVDQMVLLHLARVERILAGRPGLRALKIDSLARMAQVENRMRELKNSVRFERGLSEAEIRGMHVMYHAQFAALVRQAMAAELAALRRG